MKRALIDPGRCVSCVPCVLEAVCGNRAILRESPEEMPWVDFYRCAGCLRCQAVCPHRAVEAVVQPCDGRRRMGW